MKDRIRRNLCKQTWTRARAGMMCPLCVCVRVSGRGTPVAGDCRLRKRVWRLQISGTLDGKTTVLHIFSRHSLPNRKKVRRSLASSFFFLVVRRHVTGGSSYLSFDPISTGSFLIFIAVDNTLVASEGNLGTFRISSFHFPSHGLSHGH